MGLPGATGYAKVAGLDSIIGHRTALGLLETLLVKDYLAHALLFSGMKGLGKRTVAKLLAMALNCQNRQNTLTSHQSEEGLFPNRLPCKGCRTCRSIAAGNHPDVIVIDTAGEQIKIEQVRDLISAVSMKAYGNGTKVAIVAEAENLTAQAANALLKTLEEPPGDTVIILTATQANELLPTIVSRCQQIRFGSVRHGELSAWLCKQIPGLDLGQAKVLAALADGRPAKALDLAGGAIEQRDRLVAMAGLDTVEALNAKKIIPALTWAAEMASDREAINGRLDILETWLRDLAVVSIAPELVINSDRLDDLRTIAERVKTGRLTDCFEAVGKTRRQINDHANRKLAMEVLAMELAGIIRDKPSV